MDGSNYSNMAGVETALLEMMLGPTIGIPQNANQYDGMRYGKVSWLRWFPHR